MKEEGKAKGDTGGARGRAEEGDGEQRDRRSQQGSRKEIECIGTYQHGACPLNKPFPLSRRSFALGKSPQRQYGNVWHQKKLWMSERNRFVSIESLYKDK